MKGSTSTNATSIPEELEVTMIKKTKDIYSQEIKMKLPSDTTFGCIIEFMMEQGLLKDDNVIIRPSHNQNHVISQDRKISECYNIIKLRFIVQQSGNKQKGGKVKPQALREKGGVIQDSRQKGNVCGSEQCSIM